MLSTTRLWSPCSALCQSDRLRGVFIPPRKRMAILRNTNERARRVFLLAPWQNRMDERPAHALSVRTFLSLSIPCVFQGDNTHHLVAHDSTRTALQKVLQALVSGHAVFSSCDRHPDSMVRDRTHAGRLISCGSPTGASSETLAGERQTLRVRAPRLVAHLPFPERWFCVFRR